MSRRKRARRRRVYVTAMVLLGGAWGLYYLGFWPLGDSPKAPGEGRTPFAQNAGSVGGYTTLVAPADGEESSRGTAPDLAPGSVSGSSSAVRPAEVGSNLREVRSRVEAGLEARSRGELIKARSLLSAGVGAGFPEAEEAAVRAALIDIANRSVFTPEHLEGDPLSAIHVVQAGEVLAKIARQYNVTADCLAHVNGLRDKNRIRIGQRLKVVHGPFNAVILKNKHLVLVYLKDVLVAQCPVGLGEYGSTPTGEWITTDKLENPTYYPPASRGGPIIAADDPANPLGEYWIGLKGLSGDAVGHIGYGIHGTIEPETIGQDVSMGCVRLLDDHIRLLYSLMTPGESRVTIQ